MDHHQYNCMTCNTMGAIPIDYIPYIIEIPFYLQKE